MASIMDNFSNTEIDLNALPQYQEVEYQPVSKKYLIKTNISTGIFMLFVFAGWGALVYNGVGYYYTAISLIFILLFFSFRFWNNFKLQQNYGYALREKDILYKRGFLVNSTTVIPFNRIQHASVSRDMFDKFLEISSVQVFTAGGSGSDISIPGLKPEEAFQLKEALAGKLSENDS
ncbi:PH domain-containing protein [Antarcticibacterium sp. 1MA-6-2]|uniref:PH domain-containing protein n=1 Tax=Antarcticibacterium sp. 1MA-6-2 TaxID=2908210 RepID=UPI001F3BBDAC|nr:PH domain-containing protein [Antarcticibacterium sp. 1MA-6-2]UJH91262.1 PH domain-containing protein [Antarcticibacterium sp. 1MA-6-2]